MKLAEVVFELDGLPDEAILFVERIESHFTPESRVEILTLDETELKMQTTVVAALRAPGTEYFLETFLVREMVEEWKNKQTEDPRDNAELVAQIIHYAEYDA